MEGAEARPRAALVAWGVTLAAFALLLPGVFYGIPWSKTLVGADRVLRGEVPYRDFWTMYAPGQFWLAAGAFALLGRQLVAQGVVAVALYAGCCGALTSLLARQGVARWPAAGAGLVLAAALWRPAPEIVSYGPALLAILFALHGVSRAVEGGERPPLVRAGLLLGLAAVFKHDVAFHAALASAAALWLAWWGGGREGGVRRPLRATLRLAAGALVVALPVAAWLAVVAGRPALEQLVLFPATVFPRVFGEPYPGLALDLSPLREWLADTSDLRLGRAALGGVAGWLRGNVPQLAFLVAVPTLLLRARSWSAAWRGRALLWACWLPPFWMAAHVQQNTHPISVGIGCLALAALLWSACRSVPVRAALAPFALACAAGLALPPAMEAWYAASRWSAGGALGIPGSAGVRVGPEDRFVYPEVVEFVRANTAPGEPIHVGLVRNDAVVIGNQRFYWLADRPPATRHNELHPGVTDSVGVQREMIAALEAGHVRCMVLWDFGWSTLRLDRIRDRRVARFPDLGATLLDEYVAREFELVLSVNEYRVLWRKGLERPWER